ncbi:MAG: hypothetical protein MRY83_17650 [Flavobacteriales bacterium]|nr:hypothetical protein [Flavobacteriales bacterium]
MSILRALFGPSKDEIWGQIANDIGGEFIDRGFWKVDLLRYKHKEWELILDTYTTGSGKNRRTYTRMRAPFINKDGFEFTIYKETIFSGIGRFLGMQDIIIGDDFFDKEFVIKSNSEDRIKVFLNDQRLKELFIQQPQVHLEIKDSEGVFGPEYPPNVDLLYFSCSGLIKDKKTLLQLFLLFTKTLERLVQIDSAYDNDPNFKLYEP